MKGYILIRQEDPPYRVVTVESDGTIRPRTGWHKTIAHSNRTKMEFEEKGYEFSMVREDDATHDQKALFAQEERDQFTTRNGYEFGEVASALQKEIRRGNEVEAGFWAFELEKSGYYRYVWKRLCIIASEDIGMANPQAAILVNSLRETYMFIRDASRKGASVDFNILAHAVLYLARSPKHREVDEYGNLLERDIQGLAIPDYALDMHTKAGRGMGRGSREFWEEGAKVSPEADLPSEYAKHIPRWIKEDEEKKRWR